MDDRNLASDLLKDSKFAVISLGQAVSEITTPQLRQVMLKKLNSAVDFHYQLSDLAVSKQWYQPQLAPIQQLQQDFQLSQSINL